MTIENIQKIARSLQEFQAGKQLFMDKKTVIKSAQRFWRDEEEIEAEVTEKGSCYRVKMTIGDETVCSANCNCDREMNASYRSRINAEALCRHCVATVLQYWNKGHSFELKDVETSEVAHKLISYYAVQKRESIMEKGQEIVSLEPKMTINRDDVSVEFKIGRDKKYVIKNMYEFADAMEHGEEIEYGKSLSFIHKREYLDDFSVQIVDLIMDAVNTYKTISEMGYYNLYLDTTKMRQLTLNSFLADKFMRIMKNRSLLVLEPMFENVNSKYTLLERNKFVKEENPNLTLLIEKKGKDGASFKMKETFHIFKGAKHIYVSMDDVIYICDENFSKEVGPFLDYIQNETKKTYSDFNVNEEDFPMFCIAVLPKLEKHINIETTEVNLEEFKPQKRKTKFYLDTLNEDVICKVIHIYGETAINPYIEKDSPKDLIRDEFDELLVQEAVEQFFDYQDEDGNLHISADKEDEVLFALFDKGIASFMELGEVYISDSLKARQIRAVPNVSVGVSLSGNLLELDIDMGDLSSKELLAILESYRQKKTFHKLKDGSYLRLENGSLDTIDELTKGLQISEKDLEEGKLSLPTYRAMFIEDVLTKQEQVSSYRNEEFKNLIRNMKEIHPEDFVIPEEVSGVLRHYQEEGFRWLKLLESYGFGGILADDMGLGKTIQVISLLLSAKKEQEKNGKQKTALIVCPASLVYNWEYEFRKFAPNIKIKTITGDAIERQSLINNWEEYDALITSYDLLRRDIVSYKKKQFSYEIIDEAQFIKNYSTQNAKAVKAIQAEHRFALTGTPIENRLSELWSIFDFLMPGFLYSYTRFKSEFETPIVKTKEEATLRRFRQMTSPFILRRLKQDVLTDLPEKTEQVRYAEMEGIQSQLYNAAALKLKQELENSSAEQFNTGKVKILAQLMRLRQICCDPALCFEKYDGSSAKMEVCGNLIENSVASGHKVLLFSQFTSMLTILEEWLKKEKISYYKLTGETSKEMRMQLVSQFQQDDVPVFLISLKAGGTGLNLTAADTVIHYDPWWNVAAQNQATDRTHRIGQKRPVSVYRIITKGTIEEKILELQEAKRDLTEQILSGERGSLGSMSREELLEILG